MRVSRGIATALLMAFSGWAFADSVIYDSIPSPEPPNLPSLGYQATQTDEFGDMIQFAGTDRLLTDVTVGMSNWALRSTYMTETSPGVWTPQSGYDHVVMNADGYYHTLTLTLYEVSGGGVGSAIASQSIDAFIPWRPEPYVVEGQAYNGIFNTQTFDFSGLNVVLPDTIIYGLAYNTNTWGETPITKPGPYESLNFALSTTGTFTGIDVNTDAVFWDTSTAAWYADGGAGGTDIFRMDTNWTGYTPAIMFEAAPVPEPASLSLLALCLGGLAARQLRKRA